jgi:hypothetical protein
MLLCMAFQPPTARVKHHLGFSIALQHGLVLTRWEAVQSMAELQRDKRYEKNFVISHLFIS